MFAVRFALSSEEYTVSRSDLYDRDRPVTRSYEAKKDRNAIA